MPTDKPRLNVTLSPAQMQALDQARGQQDKAEFIREAVAAACKKAGVAFPDDVPRRGTYKREQSKH